MKSTASVRTCLWFDGQGEEAARFYVSLLPGSAIEGVQRPTPDGPAFIVEFSLAGAPYMILDGGPKYSHTPAASISVSTGDQETTDRLWGALTADGGEESRCGWLVDRFGVSWQIVPRAGGRSSAGRCRPGGGRAGASGDDADAQAGCRRDGSGVSGRLTTTRVAARRSDVTRDGPVLPRVGPHAADADAVGHGAEPARACRRSIR